MTAEQVTIDARQKTQAPVCLPRKNDNYPHQDERCQDNQRILELSAPALSDEYDNHCQYEEKADKRGSFGGQTQNKYTGGSQSKLPRRSTNDLNDEQIDQPGKQQVGQNVVVDGRGHVGIGRQEYNKQQDAV